MNFLVFILAFVSMEGVAWFTHKYIMHGLLWGLHKDHHYKEHYGFYEHNDWFFLIFATPGIICILLGVSDFSWPFWLGMGITAYGLAYFLIHDVFIHQRIRWFRKTDNKYFRAIRKAHKVHHKIQTKHGCTNFGMLWVPIKFFKEVGVGIRNKRSKVD